jgi:hypothetical protein
VYGPVRTVVWEDGRGDPPSYPIEEAPMQCYKESIRPALSELMAQASDQADATVVHRKLE